MRGTIGTQSTLFFVFGFFDIESGLHYIQLVDVAVFKDLCYDINEKSNGNIDSTLNSIH